MPVLLLSVLLAAQLHLPMPQLRFGLSTEQWQTIVSNTQGQISAGYQVTQTLRTPVGETLVRWSSTPALDPKGPHSLGVQVYGPDGTFRHWLPDTRAIDRDFVLCGRYLVGGQNTLRVWDTGAGDRPMGLRTGPASSSFGQLACMGPKTLSVLGVRYALPTLTPIR